MTNSARQLWRRATAAIKDKRSIYLTLVPGSGSRKGNRNPDMEAAIIRATSHDDRSIDYKNAARVFAWARTSPSFLSPLMWALARRATRTQSWPVALKSLLLVHGLLLLSSVATSSSSNSTQGRLPFDLSDFHDRSPNSWGFSAFVKAYFQFLDNRSLLLSVEDDDGDDCGLKRIKKLQTLLDLLMQIKPYEDGMEIGLILEAMDCVLIEIFDIYSGICKGIAMFLVNVLGSNTILSKAKGKEEEEWRMRGLKGIGMLRKSAEQSTQLSDYFDMCRSLGVLNATELPPVERISEKDIMDLENLVIGGIPGNVKISEEQDKAEEKDEKHSGGTIVTKDWVMFEDELNGVKQEYLERWQSKPLLCSVTDRPLASMVHSIGSHAQWNGDLIQLM